MWKAVKMQYYHSSKSISLQNTAVACGKFDGIHLGHQALLNQLFDLKQQGLQPTVFTFDTSISAKMAQDGFIYTRKERAHILAQMGIANLAEYVFDEAFASMQPEQFIKTVLVEQLGAKAVVVGEDFRFGCQRSGDITTLEKYAPLYDYQLYVVPKQQDIAGKISSSRIREAILTGDMKKAAAMLGRPYFVMGEVIYGQQLGRTIGMPTANVAVPEHKIVPPKGVYITRSRMEQQVYYGITNIGSKPTVKGTEVGVETYLFDFQENIYGKQMQVEFLQFCRKEQCFSSIEELTEQMHKDAQKARLMLEEYWKKQ